MGTFLGFSGCTGAYSTLADVNSSDLTLGQSGHVYSDAGTTPALNGQPVRQWYDESGSGNHATQATAANRPLFRQFGGWHPVGAQACVSFDGAASQYLTLPAGVAMGNGGTANEGTVLMAMRGAADQATFVWYLGNIGFWQVSVSQVGIFRGGNNPMPTPARMPVLHPFVQAVRFKAGESRYYYGSGPGGYNEALSTNYLSGTQAGGYVGAYTSAGFYPTMDLTDLAFFNRALSDAEMAAALGLLQDRVCPEWTNSAQVLFFGDSRTAGADSNVSFNFPAWRSWPSRMLRRIGGYARANSIAHAGDTVANQQAAFTASQGTLSTRYARNLAVGELGINDVRAGTPAATIQSSLAGIWSSMLANGATAVLALTIAPASSLTGGQEAVRQAVNAWMTTPGNVPAGVTVVDNAADPRLVTSGYADVDGLHWTDAGYGVYAANAAAAVRAALGIAPGGAGGRSVGQLPTRRSR